MSSSGILEHIFSFGTTPTFSLTTTTTWLHHWWSIWSCLFLHAKTQILNSIVKDIFLTCEEEGKAIWQFNVSSTLQVGSIPRDRWSILNVIFNYNNEYSIIHHFFILGIFLPWIRYNTRINMWEAERTQLASQTVNKNSY